MLATITFTSPAWLLKETALENYRLVLTVIFHSANTFQLPGYFENNRNSKLCLVNNYMAHDHFSTTQTMNLLHCYLLKCKAVVIKDITTIKSLL